MGLQFQNPEEQRRYEERQKKKKEAEQQAAAERARQTKAAGGNASGASVFRTQEELFAENHGIINTPNNTLTASEQRSRAMSSDSKPAGGWANTQHFKTLTTEYRRGNLNYGITYNDIIDFQVGASTFIDKMNAQIQSMDYGSKLSDSYQEQYDSFYEMYNKLRGYTNMTKGRDNGRWDSLRGFLDEYDKWTRAAGSYIRSRERLYSRFPTEEEYRYALLSPEERAEHDYGDYDPAKGQAEIKDLEAAAEAAKAAQKGADADTGRDPFAFGPEAGSEYVYGNVDVGQRARAQSRRAGSEAEEGTDAAATSEIPKASADLGVTGTFGGRDFAYSPVTVDDEGNARVLSGAAIAEYFKKLLARLRPGATRQEILDADREGADVDGEHVSGIIADVGTSSAETARRMNEDADRLDPGREVGRILAETGYETIEDLEQAIKDKKRFDYEARSWEARQGAEKKYRADANRENTAARGKQLDVAETHFEEGVFTPNAFNPRGDSAILPTPDAHPYDGATEEEKQVYWYLKAAEADGTAEAGSAARYLDALRDELNQRQAKTTFKQLKDNRALEYLFAIPAGIDQFMTGMANLIEPFSGSEYIPPTPTAYASGMVREDLPEGGRVLYDLLTTTANMAPSIGAGAVANFLLPGSGSVISGVLMGGSAAGNAYAEMLNNGYDKSQALTYGLLTGASEVLMEKLLNGISLLGKTVFAKLGAKGLEEATKGIHKAWLRFAVQHGVKFLADTASETIEEGLQTAMEPVFDYLATHEWQEGVDMEQVMYDAMLGGLASIPMNLLGGAVQNTRYYNAARTAVKEGNVPALIELGKRFDADTFAGAAARQLEQTGGTAKGDTARAAMMLSDIGDGMDAQISRDTARQIAAEGVGGKNAKKLQDLLGRTLQAGRISKRTEAALDAMGTLENGKTANQTFTRLLRKAMDSRGSANMIRAGYTRAMTGRETAYGVDYRAVGERQKAERTRQAMLSMKALGIDVTALGSKVDAQNGVTPVGITELKDGKMLLRLSDGSTADADSIKYKNRTIAAAHEFIRTLDAESTQANKLIRSAQVIAGTADIGFIEALRDLAGFYTHGVANYTDFSFDDAVIPPGAAEDAYWEGQQYGETHQEARERLYNAFEAAAAGNGARDGKAIPAPSAETAPVSEETASAPVETVPASAANAKAEALRERIAFLMRQKERLQAEHDRLQNGGDDAAFKAVAETLIETNEELIRLNAALGKAETETARAKAEAEEQARIRREAEEKRKAAAAEEPTEDQQKRKNGESRPKKQKNDAVVKPVEGLRAERIRQIGEFGGMTKRQRTALKTLAITAGAIHTGDVYIFRSKLQDGQYVFADDIPGFPQYTAGTPAQNGFFDPNTGAIYIDLNAGQNGQGAILWTAGHELTHFIQKWSPTHYNILSEFLAETYGEAELNVLIDNQIEKAKGNGRTLTRAQAQAEVVADAMQTMFTDGDLLEKVVRLANRDKGLVGKIRVFLAKMAQKIISFAHNGLVHEADEARLLIEKGADLERLANVFAEGLQKAGENYGGTKSSAYSQTENPAQVQDIKESSRKKQKSANHSNLIDEYDETQYNAYGWARVNGVLTEVENETLRSVMMAIETGREKHHPVSRFGEYMILLGNNSEYKKLVYIKGTVQDPVITKVYSGDSFSLKEVEKLESLRSDDAIETIEILEGIGFIKIHRVGDYAPYLGSKRQSRTGSERTSLANFANNPQRTGSASEDSGAVSHSEKESSPVLNEGDDTLTDSGFAGSQSGDSQILYSARTVMTDNQRAKAEQALSERFPEMTRTDVRRWLQTETSLASVILNPKFREYLDYEADPNEKAIKKNSDYPQGTVDFSPVCPKRRALSEIMNKVFAQFPNHVFSPTDLADVLGILRRHGVTIPCQVCFVEDRRQLDSVVADLFIRSLEAYRDGKTSLDGEKEFNAGQTKALQMAKDLPYTPTVAELVTPAGRTALQKKAPDMVKAWTRYNNARGMQAVRLLLPEAEYKREILRYSKRTVESKNKRGGLRIYSFSDFELFHLIDIVQVLTDCATNGLRVQGYTKVNEYARAVQNTHAKLNRSLIPRGKRGYVYDAALRRNVLVFDTREGIDVNSPDFFDSKDHPDIGNTVIGINDEMIRIAMTDDRIDQIIPFHTSQADEVLRRKGLSEWLNYKTSQTDKIRTVDADGNVVWKTAKQQVNIYTDVIEALEAEGTEVNKRTFTEKFLEVCRERGLQPRFSQFLDRDGEGNYVYTEGYYKFLVDFKTFAHDRKGTYLPQMEIVPEFDQRYLTNLLKSHAQEKMTADDNLRFQMPRIVGDIIREVVRPEFGTDSSAAIHSDRDPRSVDRRTLLSNALMSAAATDAERAGLTRYQRNIEEMNELQEQLDGIRDELTALSGKKDAQSVRQRRKLQQEALVTSNRIAAYDRQLLRMEAAAPLQNVIKTERENVRARERETARRRADRRVDTAVARERAKNERQNARAAAAVVSAEIDLQEQQRRALEREKQKSERALQEQENRRRRETERLGRKVEQAEADAAHLRERIRQDRESRKATGTRNKIRKLRQELQDRILNGRDTTAIPQELTGYIMDVIDMIDPSGASAVRFGVEDPDTLRVTEQGRKAGLATVTGMDEEQIRVGLETGDLTQTRYKTISKESILTDEQIRTGLSDGTLREVVRQGEARVLTMEAVREGVENGTFRLEVFRKKRYSPVRENETFDEQALRAGLEDGSLRLRDGGGAMETVIAEEDQIRAAIDSGVFERVTETADGRRIYRDAEIEAGVKDGTYERISRDVKTENARAAMERLRKIYDGMRNDRQGAFDDPKREQWANGWVSRISEQIGALADAVDDTPLREMQGEQLDDVYTVLRVIVKTISDANKLLGTSKKHIAYDFARSGAEELVTLARKKEEHGAVRAFASRVNEGYRNGVTNVVRVMRELTGYNDGSALWQLFSNVNNGVRIAQAKRMEMTKALEATRATEEDLAAYADACETPVDFGLKDVNGEAFSITKMQAIQLLLTWMRENANDGPQHLSNIVYFPDAELQRKGKYAEAKRRAHILPAPDESVFNAILGKLDMNGWDGRYIRAAQHVLYDLAPDAINEVSAVMFGVPIARELYYIPYEVSDDYVEISLDNVSYDAQLTGMGMLKSTQKGANAPLIMRGVNEVLDRHVQDAAKMYGLMIPIRDMQTVLNGRMTVDDRVELGVGSVQEAMLRAWGDGGVEVLKKALADVQSPRHYPDARFITRVWNETSSRLVVATLASNLSVSMKQMASYFTAGVYLSDGAMRAGLGYLAQRLNKEKRQAIWDEIDEHTPNHWLRRQGQSTQELGDANQRGGKQRPGWHPLNWIQAADVGTTAALWIAAKAQVKSDIRGTDVEVGSDGYWQRVTELYDRIIEDTQPMYDPLHRAEITKTRLFSPFVKFQTQPLQNAGVLRESANQMAAYRKRYGKKSDQAKAAAKQYARAVTSQLVPAAVFTSMTALSALVMHRVKDYRDDEDGNLTPESFFTEMGWQYLRNIASNTIPLLGGWLWDTVAYAINGKSFDVVSDFMVEKINTSLQAFAKLFSADSYVSGKEGAKEPDLQKIYSTLSGVATDVLGYLGIPAANALKIAEGLVLHIKDAIDKQPFSFEAGFERTAKQRNAQLFNAIKNGDTALQEALKKQYKTESAYHSAIATMLKENDPRIEEAADLKEAMLYREYFKKLREVQMDHFAVTDIVSAINSVLSSRKPASESEYEEKLPFKANDVEAPIRSNNQEAYKLLNTFLHECGVSLKDVHNKAQETIKSMFTAGELTEEEAMDYLGRYVEMDAEKAFWKIREWKGTSDNDGDGKPDTYKKYEDFTTAVETGENLDEVIRMYTDHGADVSDLTGALSSAFKKKYMEANESDRRTLGERILDAYEALGKDRWKSEKEVLGKWRYMAEHDGSDKGYSIYNDFFDAVLEGTTVKSVIADYITNGKIQPKTLATQISKHFHPIFYHASQTERAEMLPHILTAYELLGYDREKKRSDIVEGKNTNWFRAPAGTDEEE